jgi:mannose/fructose/N-acetylgalactosamine-specific phosphotransferase system component IIC
MVADPATIAILILLGTWAGIDSTSVGQFMVSRPVVSATLAGWVAGDAAAGALVGLVLEAIYLTVLPVGASRYPEVGPAAVVAGALFARSPGDPAIMLTVALFALTWAALSGASVRLIRKVNIRLMEGVSTVPDAAIVLARRHVAAVLIDVSRAAVMTATGLVVLAAAIASVPAWTGTSPAIAHVALWSLAAAGLSAGLHLFGDRRRRLFLVGAACGALFLALA